MKFLRSFSPPPAEEKGDSGIGEFPTLEKLKGREETRVFFLEPGSESLKKGRYLSETEKKDRKACGRGKTGEIRRADA